MNGRRGRPTLRCLRVDLGLKVPPLRDRLDDIDHPWIDEVRRIAPESPTGQKRILSIASPLVYRLRVSTERGATWLDTPLSVVWLCAVHKREADSDNDAFEYFQGLHARGELLPTDEDHRRLRAESAVALARELSAALIAVVERAIASPNHEVNQDLSDWMPCRVLVRDSGGMQEIWCGLCVVSVDGSHIDERLRNAMLIDLERHLSPIEMETRGDWVTGEAAPWYELVRYGIR